MPDYSINYQLPKGCIVLWYGSIATIPLGYHLCNGSSGTPDLRDSFIVGAKQDDGGISKTNITGSLTKSGGNVAHYHGIDIGLGSGTAIIDSGGTGIYSPFLLGTSDDSTVIAVPYYALAYIMKL